MIPVLSRDGCTHAVTPMVTPQTRVVLYKTYATRPPDPRPRSRRTARRYR